MYLVKKDLCAGGAGRYGERTGGSLAGVYLVKRICELVGQAGMVIGQVDHLLGCTW